MVYNFTSRILSSESGQRNLCILLEEMQSAVLLFTYLLLRYPSMLLLALMLTLIYVGNLVAGQVPFVGVTIVLHQTKYLFTEIYRLFFQKKTSSHEKER